MMQASGNHALRGLLRLPVDCFFLLPQMAPKSLHLSERASTFSFFSTANNSPRAQLPSLQRSDHQLKSCISGNGGGKKRCFKIEASFGAKSINPPKKPLLTGSTTTNARAVSVVHQSSPSLADQKPFQLRLLSLLSRKQQQQRVCHNHFSFPPTSNVPTSPSSLFLTSKTTLSKNTSYHSSYRYMSSSSKTSQLFPSTAQSHKDTSKMDHLTQQQNNMKTKRSCSFFDSSSDSSDQESSSLSSSPKSSSSPTVDPLSQLPNLSESGHRSVGSHNLWADQTFPNLMKLKVPGVEGQIGNGSSPPSKVYRIVVEGNIGSGKTTFLKIFAKNCASMRHKPLIVPEPIDLWRDVGGANIFQLLADDPKRWSFAFQSYVQLTMIKIHEMQPDAGSTFKVMERSLFSARYCFVENLRKKDLLSPCEHFILDEWFKASLPSASVDLIIYLKSDPDVVFERIKARGRPEEAGISLEYLRTLHELHEDWLVRGKYPLPAQVLTIDANTPLEEIVSVYEAKTDGILRKHTLSV